MKRLWSRMAHIGVDAEAPEAEIRFVTLVNVLAFITGSAQVAQGLNLLPYWDATKTAVVYSFASAPAYFLVLLLNHFRRLYVARVYFNTVGLVQIAGIVLVFGVETNSHIIFLLISITAFFIYPRSQKRTMFLFVALPVVVMVIVFALLQDVPPLTRLPPPLVLFGKYNALLSVTVFFIAFTYYIWSTLTTAEARLAFERKRSEDLLHSILPEQIADRLKDRSETVSDGFESASILFADIVGFTDLARRKSPAEIVSILNEIFSRFDDLVDKFSLEKIKTIGDAYMVAGGIPNRRADHATATCRFACEMVTALKDYNGQSGENLEIRIGINSGPVVAGVIGKKKFIYDLWGDSVNTAARMESHGLAGEIQITQGTCDLVEEVFDVEDRGEIAVKGKGMMRVYLLQGEKGREEK